MNKRTNKHMNKRNERVVATMMMALLIGLTPATASADAYSERVFEENRVSGSAIVLDMVIARPLLLASTAVGGALFLVTAPFALVGGTTGQVWNTLVVTPAGQTFVRCLGCTPVQHERNKRARQSALATAAAGEAPAQP